MVYVRCRLNNWLNMFHFSGAEMCFNCSLSVKSKKFGEKIVFDVLMDIWYSATAKI